MVRDKTVRVEIFVRVCLALLLVAGLFAVAARPALASAPPPAEACLAYPQSEADYARLLAGGQGWNCNRTTWSVRSGIAVLRFALPDGKVPERFSTRLSKIGSLRLGIVDRGGRIAWHTPGRDALVPSGHLAMTVPFPRADQGARAALVEITDPVLPGTFTMAAISSGPRPEIHREEVFMAMLCGLLLAPLLFSLAIYRVLRERFLLWHGAVVIFMLLHVMVTSGLSRYVVPVASDIAFYLVVLTYSAGAAAAIMLARSFIEPAALPDRMRRMLLLGAAWTMFNCAVLLGSADSIHETAARIYFTGWLPTIAVLVWVMIVAARRGSRVVWYQIAAWSPLIVVGTAQIVTNGVGLEEPLILHDLIGAAIVWEVILISLGIMDRLVNLRRDLDRQRRKVTKLEHLAERDPLTGLMNRRAIEPHFSRLRAEGFATFAVIDLDQFKDINDRYGHAIGDKVLQAAARALTPSDDMLSMRLGGEEFVLLLRGVNAVRHAEWCRRALSNRIAAEVEGLDRLVTASMGLVEIPQDVMPDASFAAIYARADGLLYQAKRGGRNRTVKERLSSFGKPRQRRQAGRAA